MVYVKRAKTHLVFLSYSLHALQELAPRATQSLSNIGNQVYEWQPRSQGHPRTKQTWEQGWLCNTVKVVWPIFFKYRLLLKNQSIFIKYKCKIIEYE